MVLKDKQEKFAQAYVLYRNATESAKVAGYAPRSAYNQGSRLLKLAEVRERIEDLEKEMETSIDYVSEIEKQYTYATNNNHTNSALKALELLSRLVLLRMKMHRLLLKSWKKISLRVLSY